MIGKSLGRYKIQGTLGAGGMGEVYRAWDDRLKRDVAVKVLPPGTFADEEARKRLKREALALSKLNHPHVSTVHDFGTEAGVDFLVMELVEGATLTEKLSATGLPEKEVTRLGAQLAAGLEAAHGQGLVHRDLKPDNIKVTPDGQAKILDFGIAKLTGPADDVAITVTLTNPHAIAGTLPYMSPEQLRGESVDKRTDIYALGAVLFEMATGRRAFPEKQPTRLTDAILHKMPPPPRSLNLNITPELERIILKCLDKDPLRRYQSTQDLRVDLERVNETGAMVTPEMEPPRKLFQPASRGWILSASGIGIAVALFFSFWITRSKPALSFETRDWVLITDFENQTGDSLFEKSLLTAFTVSLEQSTHANVFPRSRIAEVLKRMGRSDVQKIDEALGREICVREGIRGLIQGSINRIGQQYALSAQLINPQTGESVRSYLMEAADEDHILEALGTIAAKLRRDLGESLISINRYNGFLPQVTTSSLPALKLYADGAFLWAKGKWAEALRTYEAALEYDPDFAMVHAALGICYSSHVTSNMEKARIHFEKALVLAERITHRERLLVEAEYASAIGQTDKAIQLFNVYLEEYPDQEWVRYNLANTLRRKHRVEEAIEQYQEVIRINPAAASAYINLAVSYLQLGRNQEALPLYDRAFELEPTWITSGNLNHEYGFALIRAGNHARAREVFELSLTIPQQEALAHRSLALLDLHEGKLEDALEHLSEAVLLSRVAGSATSEARNRLFKAIVLEAKGDSTAYLDELDQATNAIRDQPPWAYIIGCLGIRYARAGALAKARDWLARIENLESGEDYTLRSIFHRLQGEVELASGNHDRAVELLLLADREDPTAMTSESLAHAYATTGNLEQTIIGYEKFVELPNTPIGWEPQHRWVESHYILARAYLSRGEEDRARELIDRLLVLWSDADVEYPLRDRVLELRDELDSRNLN